MSCNNSISTHLLFLSMCVYTHTLKGHSINNVNIPKELAVRSTVYSSSFYKKISRDVFFHFPEDCHSMTFFTDHCTGNIFFTGKSECFHSIDCLFNLGSL